MHRVQVRRGRTWLQVKWDSNDLVHVLELLFQSALQLGDCEHVDGCTGALTATGKPCFCAGNWSQRFGKHHSLISFNTLSQSSLTSKMIRMSLFHFGEFPLCLKQSGAWKPLMCRQCLEKRGSFVLRKGLALLWPEERKQDQRPHQNRSLRRSPCFRLRYKTNTQGRMKSLKMPTTCLLKS